VVSFSVNGQNIEYNNESKNLLAFLRDDLRLTSVKEGCSEGACGTCMVLVDEKAARACLFKLSKLEGIEYVFTAHHGFTDSPVYPQGK